MKGTDRRLLLAGGSALVVSTVLPLPQTRKPAQKEEEVSPAEDLMREHGALNRILLIYEEAAARIEGQREFPPEVLASSAKIIRRFIEEYHEKLEEEHLFPKFEKAGKLTDLVRVLRQQHAAGRKLTAMIEGGATVSGLRDEEGRSKVSRSLKLFIRMYRPHEAREDTVLFPALHGIVSPREYDALGEQFEKKEHELFGAEGFEKVVEEIAGLEKKIGLDDLARFTPAL